MSAALRRLASDLTEPVDDPHREQALLAMFDQGRRHHSHGQKPVWTSLAAAVLAFAAVLTWHLTGRPSAPRTHMPPIAVVAPEREQAQALDSASLVTAAKRPASSLSGRPRRAQHADRRLDEAPDSTEFVAWPGATAWPPFESGQLIRIDIPTEVGVVQAEVLVGQDGFARAVRLVQ